MKKGLKMKALRQRSGLSQEKFAHSIGKTVSAVAKWDQGKNFPSLHPSEMVLLMKTLGCTLDELLDAETSWRKSKAS